MSNTVYDPRTFIPLQYLIDKLKEDTPTTKYRKTGDLCPNCDDYGISLRHIKRVLVINKESYIVDSLMCPMCLVEFTSRNLIDFVKNKLNTDNVNV